MNDYADTELGLTPEYSPDLETDKEEFLARITEVQPSLAVLADIREQTIRIIPGAEEGDTVHYEVVRPYTAEETEILLRDARCRMAWDASEKIFSGLLPEVLKEKIGAGYLRYVETGEDEDAIRTAESQAFPYLFAAATVSESDPATPHEAFGAAAENPELYEAWLIYGKLVEKHHPPWLKTPQPPEPGRTSYGLDGMRIESTLVLQESPGLRKESPAEQIRETVRRMAQLDQLVSEGKLQPRGAQPDFYFYREISLPDDSHPDLSRGEDLKLHIMPKSDEVANVAARLSDMLQEDSELAASISNFKVSATPRHGEETVPEIVVYLPTNTVRAEMPMRTLREEFAEVQPSKSSPRHNVSLEGPLYLAQGHGAEKQGFTEEGYAADLAKELGRDFDPDAYKAQFDSSTNHAFLIEDRELLMSLVTRTTPKASQ